MRGLLVLAFLALSCFTLGQGLDCNYCTVSEFGYCRTPDLVKRTSCMDGTQQCGMARVSVAGQWIFTRLLCLNTQQCTQSPTIEQVSAISINMSCCNTPLCNAVPAIRPLSILPVTGILSLWMLTKV